MSKQITATRYHDICMGHRVAGHESKCAHLHGHNYRFHFHCAAPALDSVGRVIDFSIIKSTLCQWLEENWDHRFLIWEKDFLMKTITHECDTSKTFNMDYPHNSAKHNDDSVDEYSCFRDSFVQVPFNPTAENIGLHLINVVGPEVLKNTGVTLTKVIVEETRKCGVEVTL